VLLPQVWMDAGFAIQAWSTDVGCPDEVAGVESCYNECCSYITIPSEVIGNCSGFTLGGSLREHVGTHH
jgi:hypothetical protein